MKARKLACLATVAALGLAACGDDDDDDAASTTAEAQEVTTTEGEQGSGSSTPSTGGSGGEGTTTGVTDTEITVSGLFTEVAFGGLDVGAQARFARANAEGGVNGRMITLVDVEDDAQDPNRATDVVQRLTQQDDVFAMVPMSALAFMDPTPLADAGMPYIGAGYGVPEPWCKAEFGFSIVGCLGGASLQTETVSDYAHFGAELLGEPISGKSVAVVGTDDAATRDGSIPIVSGTYERAGANVVLEETSIPAPPATVGDFSPFIQRVMTSNDGNAPDIVELLTPSPQLTIGMAQGLRAAGFEGPIVNYLLYDPRLAEAAQGTSSVIQWAAFEQEDPFITQMIEDVQAENPDQLLTAAVASGYLQADLFISVLEAVGPDLTREAFVAAANEFEYEVPNVFGPLRFPDHKDGPLPCESIVTGTGSGFEVAVPYQCSEPAPNPLFGQ